MTIERDPWYAEWFGEEYLALYPERDDREARQQAVFVGGLLAPYARLGRLRFLDLACGTGRHAVALHEGLGGVVGLDLSARLLLQARQRQGPARPSWVRSDMRRLPFRTGSFGAVVNFFTSFGYFDDLADDARVVQEVARLLVPGGAFLSDVFNAERVIGALAVREEKTVAGARVSIRRRYDAATRRVEKEIEMGSGEEKRVFKERVRAYTEHELRSLHRAAGLTVRAAYGNFDGTPFDRGKSPRLILLATKSIARAPGEGGR
ncbi:MAG: class I SAM-dependent methyltransferase [Acidobacteriota bacterium]|nr:class I SAM-dependent methyltransferase [Acidobacteriota bacterium]